MADLLHPDLFTSHSPTPRNTLSRMIWPHLNTLTRFSTPASHLQLSLGLSGSYKPIKTQITIGSNNEFVLKHTHVFE